MQRQDFFSFSVGRLSSKLGLSSYAVGDLFICNSGGGSNLDLTLATIRQEWPC